MRKVRIYYQGDVDEPTVEIEFMYLARQLARDLPWDRDIPAIITAHRLNGDLTIRSPGVKFPWWETRWTPLWRRLVGRLRPA